MSRSAFWKTNQLISSRTTQLKQIIKHVQLSLICDKTHTLCYFPPLYVIKRHATARTGKNNWTPLLSLFFKCHLSNAERVKVFVRHLLICWFLTSCTGSTAPLNTRYRWFVIKSAKQVQTNAGIWNAMFFQSLFGLFSVYKPTLCKKKKKITKAN